MFAMIARKPTSAVDGWGQQMAMIHYEFILSTRMVAAWVVILLAIGFAVGRLYG
jgi:hypothetical protein